MRAFVASLVASVALIGGFLALGGGDFEPTAPPDPCAATARAGSGSVAETLQRVGLNALSGAACELGVSRERLLLSLAGERRIAVDDERREDAFRTGLREAVDEEEQAGRLGGTQAFLIRAAIEALPVDAILDRLFGEGKLMASTEPIRIDKWLWAARLVKTRALAVEAVNGGRVHVNGARVKPSKDVGPGDELEITVGPVRRVVIVRGTAPRRASATIAQGLYDETPESVARREREAEQAKLSRPPVPVTGPRPTKRDRRRMEQTPGVRRGRR